MHLSGLSKLEGEEVPHKRDTGGHERKLEFLKTGTPKCVTSGSGLSWVMRLVSPAILILRPDADLARLSEVTSEDNFAVVSRNNGPAPLNAPKILLMARMAGGFSELGRQLYEAVGRVLNGTGGMRRSRVLASLQ